ncbi:GDP-mannose 4,6-dehydratase, partial [Candidatus Bipolaricaulota bacterium]|nr:GDP-mannose 4,6-dehydratase [Candidatus Bipolaricaulota bacterium]
IYTSTSEVYGSAQYVPMDEAHPLRGQSPYSASKIAADKMAEAFHKSFELSVVTVRPFNTYGPRQSPRAIVPTIIGQCLFGDSLRLGSLDPVRDLTFVEDTVEGFLSASACPEAAGRVLNLGTGSGVSIRELVDLVAEVVGRSPSLEIEDQRKRPAASEVSRLIADNTAMRELTGWEPRTSLEEGVRMTAAWIREHAEGWRYGTYAI